MHGALSNSVVGQHDDARRRYPCCGKELTLLLLCSEMSSSELFRSELVESVSLHMVPEGNKGG